MSRKLWNAVALAAALTLAAPILGAPIAVVTSSAAYAGPKAKKVSTGKVCTFKACVARGMGPGHNSSRATAEAWCGNPANNFGC